jgi:ABC-2 type transport system permease protein
MRNILLIAKREYLEKIRGRSFRLSTILVPLMIVAILGGSYLTQRNAGKIGSGRHIAIASENPRLAENVRRNLLTDKDAHYTIDVVAPASAADRAALLQQVQAKALDGMLDLDGAAIDTAHVVYTSRTGGIINTGRFKSALSRAWTEERLLNSGMKPAQADALFQDIPVEEKQLDKEGKSGQSAGMAPFNKALMVVFLLTMPVLLYGMDMARSIIEEKSSRIFEVMLAISSPSQMLTGKLLGVGAVGLTQVAIWVLMAAVVTGTSLAASILTGNLSIHFSLLEGILFPVYFVLGFLLYSSLFSGLAATCETAQDLQMYTPIAILPVWTSMGILPVLLNDPNSKWSVAASLFPFTSPFVMVARLGLQTPPLGQLALSLVLMVLSIWGVLWFSSRLYRVGILMYGKRATLPELLRWLRYS